jgi:hypothetical protein
MQAKQSLPPREDELLTLALDRVADRLPAAWRLKTSLQGRPRSPDAVLSIVSPNGDEALLIVEVKRTIVTRDLPMMLNQLNQYMATERSATQGQSVAAMVVARYLPPQTQNWLAERGIPYADATGNMRIALDRPALFLRDRGEDRDPWRGPGRPRGTLKGEPPARVVRALVDYSPPYSIPKVMELAGTSSGATYRVIEFLSEEDLIQRSPEGPISEVGWRELLFRWSKDYGFMRSNQVRSYLAVRGLDELMDRLARVRDMRSDRRIRYAVTGSFAAKRWEQYAPARSAMIYTDDPDELASRLDLRQVESGANVLVARAAFDVVFERTQQLADLVLVAPSQAAVDLLTGPGRNPAEGQALLDWMEANEPAWRT